MWTLLDIANIIMLFFVSIVHLGGELKGFSWIFLTIASIMFYGRLVYFMRAIKRFGWMINMMMESINKSLPFLFVLGIIILAVATSFNSYSNLLEMRHPESNLGNLEMPQAFLNRTRHPIDTFTRSFKHSYLLTLGEFDYDDDRKLLYNYYPGFVGALLFLFTTFINLIVMLNLLVAIFGKVHNDFQILKHEQTTFQYV